MPFNLNDFLTPDSISVEQQSPTSARIVLEPFERGFGHTLGNALRRILLSSMPGAAVVEVQIEGIEHEYSTLQGVREDAVEILLNLKGLAVRLHRRDSVTMILNEKGGKQGKVVTAANIKADKDVDIVNPDMVIAHLAENARLNMTIKVAAGRGYQPADARVQDDSEISRQIGVLQLDASFSPLRRMSYSVDSARVERRTDLDKLIIELETDGTLDPEEAIRHAATILQHQMEAFADMRAVAAAKARKAAINGSDPLLTKSVEELGLTHRPANCLRSEGIEFIGDLVQRTQEGLLKSPNLGKKALAEIVECLESKNLSLGMVLDDWQPPDLVRKPPAKEHDADDEADDDGKAAQPAKARGKAADKDGGE